VHLWKDQHSLIQRALLLRTLEVIHKIGRSTFALQSKHIDKRHTRNTRLAVVKAVGLPRPCVCVHPRQRHVPYVKIDKSACHASCKSSILFKFSCGTFG